MDQKVVPLVGRGEETACLRPPVALEKSDAGIIAFHSRDLAATGSKRRVYPVASVLLRRDHVAGTGERDLAIFFFAPEIEQQPVAKRPVTLGLQENKARRPGQEWKVALDEAPQVELPAHPGVAACESLAV